MSDKNELLPCPFCGTNDHLYKFERDSFVWVGCNAESGGCGLTSGGYEDWGDLFEQWNTRHTPPGYIKKEDSDQRVYGAVRAARKGWAKQATIPDGYKLVPVEATEGVRLCESATVSVFDGNEEVYRATAPGLSKP